MNPIKIFCLIGLAVFCNVSIAQSPIAIKSGQSYSFGKGLEFYVDSSSTADLSSLKGAEFQDLQSGVLNLASIPYPVWVRFSLINESNSSLFLEIGSPLLEEIEVYEIGDSTESLLYSGGIGNVFDHRPILAENWTFNLELKQGESRSYYLKARTGYPFLMPINVSEARAFASSKTQENVFWGLYIGIMIFAFLYNFFIFFSTRERTYLYYIIYILGSTIFYLGLQGSSFKLLWPNNPGMNFYLPMIICLTNIPVMLFTFRFLNISSEDKIPYRIGIGFIGLFIVLAGVNLSGNHAAADQLAQLFSTLSCTFYIGLGIRGWIRGDRSAKFFLIAWTLFLILVIIFILSIGGAIPSNSFTSSGIYIGHMTEVILLSFALADRINVLKEENARKQEEIIFQLKENETIQLRANQELEGKVVERTKEVVRQKEEIQETLMKLKTAQTQLVESEKMASLGQLTAGIAHEINNPVNFIISNIDSLKLDLSEVKQVVEKYQAIKSEGEIVNELKEASDYAKEMDLNFLFVEMQGLVEGIEEGSKRTRDIVSGLKNFSRLDEDGFKEIDLHKGLDSTLALLDNKLNNITIIKEYDPNFPLVESIPGKLNQVFMNILDNSITAIGDKGNIRITTGTDAKNAWIKIKDDGIGIKEEIQSRIFEPFFTTKDVGEGTGLGLSISYGIIENHKGKILVSSQPGEGTEMKIEVPIKQFEN
ncbi:MAG: 7TM diverse intracellular signaling domain-containing protein [Bacteroidia bacterium]|nr:7TM diverse intracellular signaling domain-containing protein [Bacteroidia bacterium]